MLKFLFVPFLLCISSPTILAQHIDIDKKALSFIASQEKVNVVFTFDSLTFDGDAISEAEFLQKQYLDVSEWKNEDAAKEWIQLYNDHKNKIWRESFVNSLNGRISKNNEAPVFNINDSTAAYTMQVNSDWMYFGYNVIIGKQPSKVTLTLHFYKTDNPQNIIFSTEISRAMGTNNESYNLRNWPSFRRMGEAYKRAAYKLGQSLERVLD